MDMRRAVIIRKYVDDRPGRFRDEYPAHNRT